MLLGQANERINQIHPAAAAVLSYIGNGTAYLEAYNNGRPCAVAQAAHPQGRPWI
jgi:hypothetical protein